MLITGASGFIGSHVARRLLADGEEVHVLLRDGARAQRLEGLPGLHRWIGDLGDLAALKACFQGSRPERIFHCAGVHRARHASGWGQVRETMRVNVDGLINLIEAAAGDERPHSVIRLGGLEEYGAGPAPFVETQREAPRSPYSASQVAGTHLLQALQPGLPFAVITLRPALIYGPGQSTDFMIPALVEALLDGRSFPLTEGRQRRDLLFVDDLVDAMIAASTTEGLAGEVINIATGAAPRIRTVARAIGRMTGGMHLLRFGELPDRPNDTADLRGDASKADRLLGWRPKTSLARGLATTIEWHRSQPPKGCTA